MCKKISQILIIVNYFLIKDNNYNWYYLLKIPKIKTERGRYGK